MSRNSFFLMGDMPSKQGGVMETVSEYKNSPDPLLRATYWLIHFAWDNPKRFEILQELSREVEAVSKQNADLVEALDQLQRNLSKAWPRGDRSGFEQALLDTIDQALAQVKGDQS